MKQERDANDALDWDAALAGIDIIVSGRLDASDDFGDAKVHRLIERLLDQIDTRGHGVHVGEDSFLRRAIECYELEADELAVHDAHQAAVIGARALSGQFDEPDRSVPLREALRRARGRRGRSVTR